MQVRVARVAAVLGGLGLAVTLAAACTDRPDRPAPPAGGASPLAEFLGVDPQRGPAGLPQLTEDERHRQYAMEELIAGCMARQGFEYRPVPPEDRLAGTFAEAYALAPAEFARQYGYGVTTLRGAIGEPPPADPNQQIRDQLSPEALRGYERAMWGTGSGSGPGCQEQASTTVYGDQSELDQGFGQFQELLDRIGELYQQIEADPRLAAAATRWAECLAAAGYPGFSRPDDARESVFDRLSAVQGPGQPTPDPAELAAIGDYERALAPVDLACRQEHVDGLRWEVTVERERQFIDAHRAELVRYRDWLAGTREETG
jgi:hypothetical protein